MREAKYILKGHEPVAEPDVLKWGRFMTQDRHVADTYVTEEIRVSTVFLGLDHSFSEEGPLLLFETMIFGGFYDTSQKQCSTWKEAEKMHKKAVKSAKEAK